MKGRIVLNGTHVELYARTEAAVRVMVSGQKKTEVITGLPVLTSVIEWLPYVDEFRTAVMEVARNYAADAT